MLVEDGAPETDGFCGHGEIGVPSGVMADVRAASDAVDAALRARARAIELEEQSDAAEATEEIALEAEAIELWREYDRVTAV
ncbi:hypothetical protein ABGB18_01775 [Nonomuraea sp. B12E4]|uniref:hypothetical protein n=1 Tax=Nonomuraea sp. B12E4 TaxID=3153564 RepID=UPI00325F05AD